MLDTAETEINFTKHSWENQLLNDLFTIRAMDFLAARSLVHCLEIFFSCILGSQISLGEQGIRIKGTKVSRQNLSQSMDSVILK